MATATKKLTQKNMKGEVTNMVFTAGGAISAGFAAQQLDKVLKIDSTTTGVKRFLTPALMLAGAIYLGVKVKDPRVKYLALGIGAAATNNLAKKAVPKIFGSLPGNEGADDLGLVPMSTMQYTGDGGVINGYGDYVGLIPPTTGSGYYLDSKASYVAGPQEEQIYGTDDVQVYGTEEYQMNGTDDAQVYGAEETTIYGIEGPGSKQRRSAAKEELYL